MDNKENLIKELASSFGMPDVYSTRTSESRFDPSTGTLYCEGVVIPKSTVDKALAHFEKQKEYLKKNSDKDASIREMYLINTVAHNAILMLLNNLKED